MPPAGCRRFGVCCSRRDVFCAVPIVEAEGRRDSEDDADADADVEDDEEDDEDDVGGFFFDKEEDDEDEVDEASVVDALEEVASSPWMKWANRDTKPSILRAAYIRCRSSYLAKGNTTSRHWSRLTL